MISGNAGDGIDVASGVTSTLIEGNYIGVDQTGADARGNSGDGISVAEAAGITIGGTAEGAGNVISANLGSGVRIEARRAGAAILGNLIGTDFTGSIGLGNGTYGVFVNETSYVIIGGTALRIATSSRTTRLRGSGCSMTRPARWCKAT